MSNIKNQFLSAVKNKVLLVGPMATSAPPLFGPTLYVDGGIQWFRESPESQLSIGDGDSASRNLDVSFPARKDSSDLQLALNLLPRTSMHLWLWGFLGGDKAHELANFGAVHHFMQGRPAAAALFDRHLLIVSAGAWQLPLKGEFSVLSMVSNEITLDGDCRYKLAKATALPAFSSFGLSNEAFGTIRLKCRHPLLILGRPHLTDKIFSQLAYDTALP